MTVSEYLELKKKHPFSTYSNYEGQEEDRKSMVDYNKSLLERYPWLEPFNVLSDGQEEHPNYDYSYTMLDDMPDGWRIAFGERMCEEINEELVKYNCVDKYRVVQIKEKYGTLCWYDNGIPIGKLSEDYIPIDQRYNDESRIKYDTDNQVLMEISKENYTPLLHEENGEWKPYTTEEHKEHNKDCIIHYGIFRILERCRIWGIINKYEKLSKDVCIDCGAQNVPLYETPGWINYVCGDCLKKRKRDD